jgi:hypothetical protein
MQIPQFAISVVRQVADAPQSHAENSFLENA